MILLLFINTIHVFLSFWTL